MISRGYQRRLEREWSMAREVIAAIYNSSANRDFKKPAVKGSDIIPLSTDPKPRFKVSRKSNGAIELPKKVWELLRKKGEALDKINGTNGSS